MERYLGVDVHGESCTFSVLSASGREVQRQVVETNGQALVGYLRQLSGTLHLCLDEGVNCPPNFPPCWTSEFPPSRRGADPRWGPALLVRSQPPVRVAAGWRTAGGRPEPRRHPDRAER